jgi:hypothetical protein
MKGHFEIVKYLVENGANIQAPENKDTDHVFDWIKQSYANDMKKSKGEDEAVACLTAGRNMFQKQFDEKDRTNIEHNPLLLIVSHCNRVDNAKFMFNQDLCYIENHFNTEEANSKRMEKKKKGEKGER